MARPAAAATSPEAFATAATSPSGSTSTPTPERASTAAHEDISLLAELDGVLGPHYRAFVVAVALVLLALLALAAWATGGDAQAMRASVRITSLDPAITVYILAVHPFMHRRWQRAIAALRALAPHAGDDDRRTARARRRGEWIAMLAGALLGAFVARHVPGVAGWLRVYGEATSALTFALLASAIYGSVGRSRQLAAHSRTGFALDVFDAHLLTPFARWGQSLTLVFVGGISLSLLFQSAESLRSVEGALVYGSLVVVALTLFFMSMWTVHVALATAQERELARVRGDLEKARDVLRRHRACETADARPHDAYLPVVVLGQYERQVLAAPTWPFDPVIVGRVFASAAAPLAVYLLKLAFGLASGA